MNMYSNSTHGNNPNVHTVTIRGDGWHEYALAEIAAEGRIGDD